MKLAFVVEGRPVPKGRPVFGKSKSGRPIVYTPRTTEVYEAKVRLHALRAMRLAGWSTTKDRCSIALVFFNENRRRVDTDNLAKAVIDGVNGLVVMDDSQFVTTHVEKYVDRARPRVEISIERIEATP